MSLNEQELLAQIKMLHVLVDETLKSIRSSGIDFNPEIVSAILFKKAGELLLHHHKDNRMNFVCSIEDNFRQLYALRN